MPTPEPFADALEAFSEILHHKRVARRTVLHPPGGVCRTIYLVRSGLLRANYLLDGRDATAHFAAAGGFVTAPDSFLRGGKSQYGIEAVADSEVSYLHRAELERHLERRPELERAARLVTEEIYLDLLHRVESLIFSSAPERYERLTREQPEVLRLANLGHIASYLGMSQETLSRVRGSR